MIIAELENWLGNKVAILEENNDAIYLYSYAKNNEVLALWVANTKEVNKVVDIKAEMEKGLPPCMPAKLCNSSSIIFDFEKLENWELQWGLEQNSIAVWYKNEIVAILPEWSGFEGFCGYSKGTISETELAWPLQTDNSQLSRFLKEREFLDNWSEDVWVDHQDALLSLYDNMFNGEARYFAIDGGKWPPKAMRYISENNFHYLFTVGLSILPMPSFGMNYEGNIEDYRRIELSIIVENCNDFQTIGQYLSAQTTYPWFWGTHFDNGHTIPCKELTDIGSKMSFMLLTETASFLPTIELPDFQSNKTRLLYMIPIYESEQKYAEKNSSSQLIELLESSKQPLNLSRNSIV